MSLILNVFTYCICRNFISCTENEVPVIPQFSRPQLFPQFRIFLKFLFNISRYLSGQYLFPVFRNLYYMIFQIVYGMFCPSYPHAVFIPIINPFRIFSLPYGKPLSSPSKLRGYSAEYFYKKVVLSFKYVGLPTLVCY